MVSTSDLETLTGVGCIHCQFLIERLLALSRRQDEAAPSFAPTFARLDQPDALELVPESLYIDPESALAQAVKTGEFQQGELVGKTPAGSVVRQSFTDAFWLYIYRTGAANTLVWCRIAKL